MFAYIAGSPYVLQELHGLSPQAYSAVFGVNAAILILLSQVSSRVVGRTGPAALLVTGATASVAGAAVLVVAAVAELGLPVLLVGLALVVGSVGLMAPNATALALADHGRTAGAASALLGVLQFFLGAVAAPFSGLGDDRADLSMALTIAVGAAVALACALLSRRQIRARSA